MAEREFYLIRRILIVITGLLLSLNTFAQDRVPQSINYQAVARDDDGYPITNKEIVVEITIRAGNETGEIVWQELHTVTTNDFGVFNLLIGKGTTTSNGSSLKFETIKWSRDDFYVQTRVDFGIKEFGNGLIDMGTVQLQSVPYALVADTALNVSMYMHQIKDVNTQTLVNGNGLKWNGSTWNPAMFITADGQTDLTQDWTISSKNVTLAGGQLATNQLKVGSGASVNKIATSINGSNPSNSLLSTEKAIVDFVNGTSVPSGSFWTATGDNSGIFNSAHDVGIGVATPNDKFHADVGKRGFLVTGDIDSKKAEMYFNANTAAFRAGLDNDKSDIGNYSFAVGQENTANNSKAFATGHKNTSSGVASATFGYSNEAEGAYSIAAGEGGGDKKNYTKGKGSFAMGFCNESYGDYSISLGKSNKTNGEASIAMGEKASTSATATGSIAGGYYTATLGMYSAAFGVGSTAASYAEFVIGQYNTSPSKPNMLKWTTSDRVFVIGNGSSPSSRSDALVVLKSGNTGIKSTKPSQALDVNGNIVASGSVTGSSDRRFKKNITPLDNALQKILAMDGVYYHWKTKEFADRDFSENRQLGLIAQDVEKIVPEVVITGTDGYKSIDYGKISALLIEALKEQQKEIEALRKENNSKDAELKAINEKYEQLNQKINRIESLLNISTSEK